jgi:hypothetical protein
MSFDVTGWLEVKNEGTLKPEFHQCKLREPGLLGWRNLCLRRIISRRTLWRPFTTIPQM